MEKVCDICGTKYEEGTNYCGGCGVDLKENNRSSEFPNKKKKNQPQKKDKEAVDKESDKVLKWCQIHSTMSNDQMTFPIFMTMLYQLIQGKKYLGFCNCSVCNLGYRELQTSLINATENKKLKPNSREIVSRFHDADISDTIFDFSNFCNGKSQETEGDALDEIQCMDYKTNTNDKISIQIDRDVFENLLIKFFSSEKGQKLIKESLK